MLNIEKFFNYEFDVSTLKANHFLNNNKEFVTHYINNDNNESKEDTVLKLLYLIGFIMYLLNKIEKYRIVVISMGVLLISFILHKLIF